MQQVGVSRWSVCWREKGAPEYAIISSESRQICTGEQIFRSLVAATEFQDDMLRLGHEAWLEEIRV